MATIEPGLLERMKAQPQERLRLIVRVVDVAAAAAQLEQRGFAVGRRFRLVPAVAVSGSAAAALTLLNEPWVESVEIDGQVATQSECPDVQEPSEGVQCE